MLSYVFVYFMIKWALILGALDILIRVLKHLLDFIKDVKGK